MQVKYFVAIVASFFLSVTGCHLGGVGAREFGPGGGNSFGAGCTCGLCSGLVGRLSRAGCSACSDSACAGGCASPNTLTPDGVGTGGGYVGPLAGLFGRNRRGAQSPTGAYPGPPAGRATGTVPYPYYCSACGDSACTGGCVPGNTLTPDGFRTGGGYVGPLAGLFGRNRRGAQSPMGVYPGPPAGAYPGPPTGPATGTVTYPYCCSACGSSACTGGCVSGNTLTPDGFRTGSGYVGPLAGLFGRNPRRAPLHMGAYPSPAVCPPTGTVTYPYYTTRGPRDFFVDDPPSIGR